MRAALAERGVTRFALVGHGHGGAVAQLVADGDPGTKALVLIDSVAFDVAPPGDLDARTFVERGSVEIADLPAADLDAYAGAPGAAPDPVDLTPLIGGMASWDFPVFLLWGEEDPYVPMAVAERLTDACPGATLGVVPDSGHFLLDDAFDPVGVIDPGVPAGAVPGRPARARGRRHVAARAATSLGRPRSVRGGR